MPAKEHKHMAASSSRAFPKLAAKDSLLAARTRTHPARAVQQTVQAPQSLSAPKVLKLQRAIGNHAVGSVLAGTNLHGVPLVQKARMNRLPTVRQGVAPHVIQRVFNYADGRQMSSEARQRIIEVWRNKVGFDDFLAKSDMLSTLAVISFEDYLANSSLEESDKREIEGIIAKDQAQKGEAALGHDLAATRHEGRPDELILNWEDLQWVEKSQLAFRYHDDAAALDKEVQSGRIGGHKHPMFYMQDILRVAGVKAENLKDVPLERRDAVVREYQKRILALSQTSLVRVKEGEYVTPGFIIAQLEQLKDEKATIFADIFGASDSKDNLITGLHNTPFGAFLGDMRKEDLQPEKFVLKGLRVLIDSKTTFLKNKWHLSDMIVQYIKERGAVTAKRLTGETARSMSNVDPESGALGIPGLRELTEEEIAAAELRDAQQRAKATEEIERGMIEIQRLSIIQAKLLAGMKLDAGDTEFLAQLKV